MSDRPRSERSESSHEQSVSETPKDQLILRLRIAKMAMQAASAAFEMPETPEARGQLDDLINDANEAISHLTGELYHTHDFGPWEDDPVGVVRRCECGVVDFRPEG